MSATVFLMVVPSAEASFPLITALYANLPQQLKAIHTSKAMSLLLSVEGQEEQAEIESTLHLGYGPGRWMLAVRQL